MQGRLDRVLVRRGQTGDVSMTASIFFQCLPNHLPVSESVTGALSGTDPIEVIRGVTGWWNRDWTPRQSIEPCSRPVSDASLNRMSSSAPVMQLNRFHRRLGMLRSRSLLLGIQGLSFRKSTPHRQRRPLPLRVATEDFELKSELGENDDVDFYAVLGVVRTHA